MKKHSTHFRRSDKNYIKATYSVDSSII